METQSRSIKVEIHLAMNISRTGHPLRQPNRISRCARLVVGQVRAPFLHPEPASYKSLGRGSCTVTGCQRTKTNRGARTPQTMKPVKLSLNGLKVFSYAKDKNESERRPNLKQKKKSVGGWNGYQPNGPHVPGGRRRGQLSTLSASGRIALAPDFTGFQLPPLDRLAAHLPSTPHLISKKNPLHGLLVPSGEK